MTEADVGDRFRELVKWLVRRDGKYGGKKRVADLLGIHPTDISKIISGERRVGWDLAMRAAASAGVDPAYFHNSDSPSRYVGPSATWAEAAVDARSAAGTLPAREIRESPADLRKWATSTSAQFQRGGVDLLDVVRLAQHVTASPLYVGAREFLSAYERAAAAAELSSKKARDESVSREERAAAEHEFALAFNRAVVAAAGFLGWARVAGLEPNESDGT